MKAAGIMHLIAYHAEAQVAQKRRASYGRGSFTRRIVPSLFRFLLIILILAGLIYAGMWAMVSFVQPQPREMSQTLPSGTLNGK